MSCRYRYCETFCIHLSSLPILTTVYTLLSLHCYRQGQRDIDSACVGDEDRDSERGIGMEVRQCMCQRRRQRQQERDRDDTYLKEIRRRSIATEGDVDAVSGRRPSSMEGDEEKAASMQGGEEKAASMQEMEDDRERGSRVRQMQRQMNAYARCERGMKNPSAMAERDMLADPPISLLPLGTQRHDTSTSPPSLRRLAVGQVRDNISLPLSPLRRPPSLPVCDRSGVLPLFLSITTPASSLSPCLSPLRPRPSLPVSLRSGLLPLSLSLSAPALVLKSHPRAFCSSSPAP
ncbi:hypothetical protein ACLOJK_016153 [Asimina triloba]